MTPEERQKREAAIRTLAERWPKCFAVDEKRRRPLKVGIAEEVRALLPDIDVSSGLALYTRSTSYMKALVAGAVRIGLDGEPAGRLQQSMRPSRGANSRNEKRNNHRAT